MRETIQKTCLPLLRILNLDDIRRYMADKSSGQLKHYLGILLRFLVQNIRRYPFLKYLVCEILEFSENMAKEGLEGSELEHEIAYSRAVLHLRNYSQMELHIGQVISDCFNVVHEAYGGKRLNAALAIILADLTCGKPENNSLVSAKDSWKPILQGHPSSLERIAMAHIVSSLSVPLNIFLGADVRIKTLLAFVFLKRKLYVLARDILKDVVASVEIAHATASWEHYIVVAELVKCCNTTQDVDAGKYWAEQALSTLSELSWTANDEDSANVFVHIALVDSLLAIAQYEDAVNILQKVLLLEGLDPSTALKVCLRLSKAQRRQGEIFPSQKILKILLEGLRVLDQVSPKLRLAFVEETLCHLNRVDIADDLISQTAREASETIAHMKSEALITGTQDVSQHKYAEILEGKFQVLYSLNYAHKLRGDKIATSTSSNDIALKDKRAKNEQRFLLPMRCEESHRTFVDLETTTIASEGREESVFSHGQVYHFRQCNETVTDRKLFSEATSASLVSSARPILGELVAEQVDKIIPSGPVIYQQMPQLSIEPQRTSQRISESNHKLNEVAAGSHSRNQPSMVHSSGPSAFFAPIHAPQSQSMTHSHSFGRSHGRKSRRNNTTSISALIDSSPPWPPVSFLFVVNELPINKHPSEGGVAPRADENGRWAPPIYRAGFFDQIRETMFRWRDGVISRATGCQWYNGDGWDSGNIQLIPYRTTSMFWTNEWTQFLTADRHASTRDMAISPFPLNRWYPLMFHHDGTLSRVDSSCEDHYLAGTTANWIGPLGLGSHNNRHAPQSTGLAGNLPTIIGLIAFSCQAADFDAILLNDRAWRHYEWRGHNRDHGRYESRGIVVNTYPDPENMEGGSTNDTLYPLEWNQGPLLR